jgi:uncharacterized membrane protein
MSLSVLLIAVFVATTVEMVEALTIVVAVGHAVGWRSARQGVFLGLGTLVVLVAVFGPALVHLPLSPLRVGVGAVLLIMGLQWLRKGILRGSGYKAKHDEDAIYLETVVDLRSLPTKNEERAGIVMAFKGVFLEGVEAIVLVLTLGATSRHMLVASIDALVAVSLVSAVGFMVAKQLANVPENAMKLIVGVMLTSYGTFWLGEGLWVRWPGSDSFLLVLCAAYAVVITVFIRRLEARKAQRP